MAQLPFFGRAWSVSVDTQDGNHYVVRSLVGPGEEPLTVRFTVEMYALLAYWNATIEILNMSTETARSITAGTPDVSKFWKFNQPLVLGDSVSLSAGYASGSSGSFEADSNLLFNGK